MRGAVLLVLLGLTVGCGADRRKEAVDKVDHDAEYISKASGAVNAVIRAQTDCNEAKPLIPEAYARIDAAREVVDAPATHETLDALEAQVERVDQLCP